MYSYLVVNYNGLLDLFQIENAVVKNSGQPIVYTANMTAVDLQYLNKMLEVSTNYYDSVLSNLPPLFEVILYAAMGSDVHDHFGQATLLLIISG